MAISSRTTNLSTNKVISYGFADPAGRNAKEGMGTSFNLGANYSLTGKAPYNPKTTVTVYAVRKNK